LRPPAPLKTAYFAKLRSVYEKIERLSVWPDLTPAQPKEAEISRRRRTLLGELLTSPRPICRLVWLGSFPELQGTMGCYYAQHDKGIIAFSMRSLIITGRSDQTTSAKRADQHCCSLADKIDTLVAFLVSVKRPAARAVIALRRAALG
jgi:glycyl-tRNA synthetase beta subunit